MVGRFAGAAIRSVLVLLVEVRSLSEIFVSLREKEGGRSADVVLDECSLVSSGESCELLDDDPEEPDVLDEDGDPVKNFGVMSGLSDEGLTRGPCLGGGI